MGQRYREYSEQNPAERRGFDLTPARPLARRALSDEEIVATVGIRDDKGGYTEAEYTFVVEGVDNGSVWTAYLNNNAQDERIIDIHKTKYETNILIMINGCYSNGIAKKDLYVGYDSFVAFRIYDFDGDFIFMKNENITISWENNIQYKFVYENKGNGPTQVCDLDGFKIIFNQVVYNHEEYTRVSFGISSILAEDSELFNNKPHGYDYLYDTMIIKFNDNDGNVFKEERLSIRIESTHRLGYEYIKNYKGDNICKISIHDFDFDDFNESQILISSFKDNLSMYNEILENNTMYYFNSYGSSIYTPKIVSGYLDEKFLNINCKIIKIGNYVSKYIFECYITSNNGAELIKIGDLEIYFEGESFKSEDPMYARNYNYLVFDFINNDEYIFDENSVITFDITPSLYTMTGPSSGGSGYGKTIHLIFHPENPELDGADDPDVQQQIEVASLLFNEQPIDQDDNFDINKENNEEDTAVNEGRKFGENRLGETDNHDTEDNNITQNRNDAIQNNENIATFSQSEETQNTNDIIILKDETFIDAGEGFDILIGDKDKAETKNVEVFIKNYDANDLTDMAELEKEGIFVKPEENRVELDENLWQQEGDVWKNGDIILEAEDNVEIELVMRSIEENQG